MGTEAYAKQTPLEKETYVYDELLRERHRLSQAEIDHATSYINSERSKASLSPLS